MIDEQFTRELVQSVDEGEGGELEERAHVADFTYVAPGAIQQS